MGELNIWLEAIGNVGFPVLVTFYLLMRFEKKIDILTETIDKLIEITRKIEEKE
ncbi:YvrJ family protein [Bacillus tuaregi]|uniref:YvrJ family protein n=1 Tax=Bacillus tuaregi TaxID=1816695 RepID=UPI000A022B79|nr:YvrJ family protein [Bacillus tuaregi]